MRFEGRTVTVVVVALLPIVVVVSGIILCGTVPERAIAVYVLALVRAITPTRRMIAVALPIPLFLLGFECMF